MNSKDQIIMSILNNANVVSKNYLIIFYVLSDKWRPRNENYRFSTQRCFAYVFIVITYDVLHGVVQGVLKGVTQCVIHDAMYDLHFRILCTFLDLLPAPGWTIHFNMHKKSAPSFGDGAWEFKP